MRPGRREAPAEQLGGALALLHEHADYEPAGDQQYAQQCEGHRAEQAPPRPAGQLDGLLEPFVRLIDRLVGTRLGARTAVSWLAMVDGGLLLGHGGRSAGMTGSCSGITGSRSGITGSSWGEDGSLKAQRFDRSEARRRERPGRCRRTGRRAPPRRTRGRSSRWRFQAARRRSRTGCRRRRRARR